MAHFKRKRARTQSSGYYSADALKHRLGFEPPYFTRNYPRYWDKLHHTRPKRRAEEYLIRKVLKGFDPDIMVWPDGRRPHVYYW